jgi:SWI/SNF-related matrix-associated actin-dependent regulator of chromatin subfamily A member 5
MRDYQLEGLNWMINLHENGLNGILADEMGLGKTLQTISLMAWVQQHLGIAGPFLVLVPKSTLANWMNEIARWCPSLHAVKLHGDKDERAEFIESTLLQRAHLSHHRRAPHRTDGGAAGGGGDRLWDVLVTTYEVANIERAALGKVHWEYVIIDEAHRIKNEASSLSLTIRGFVSAHRLLITGTPLQNNLHELWALLNFLLPEVFSSSEDFDSWFNLEAEAGDDAAKALMVRQLHRVLKPFMLRRLKADVAKGLPPKTETLLYVPLSDKQREVYKGVLMRDIDSVLADRAAGTEKTRLSNLVMHLRKACQHPYLFEGVEERSLDPMGEHVIENCGKLQLLDKLLPKLQAMGSRCLIFSQFTSLLDILEDYCLIRGFKYCRIDGSTSYEDRESAIEGYNAPGSEKFLFLLSTRAGGLGINLYTADVVVLYDSDWNPQQDLQAMDRAHRIGQKKPVKVYRLVSEGTVEEKIVERAMLKLKLDAVVVQQGRLADRSKGLSKEEMLSMVRFGADAVFKAGGGGSSSISDADADEILRVGERKTQEMAEEVMKKVGSAAGVGNLDFKFDYTPGGQVFEGVDYSTEAQRKREKEEKDQELSTLRVFLAQKAVESQGQRAARVNRVYNEAEVFRLMQAVATEGKDREVSAKGESLVRRYVPPSQRPPRAYPWMLLNEQRINEITAMQIAHMRAQEQAKLGSTEGAASGASASAPAGEEGLDEPFDASLVEERAALVAEGFPGWRRGHFTAFTQGCMRHGRSAFGAIARYMAEVGMQQSAAEVRRYATAFWGPRGAQCLGKEWTDSVRKIEKREALLREVAAAEAGATVRVAVAAAGTPSTVPAFTMGQASETAPPLTAASSSASASGALSAAALHALSVNYGGITWPSTAGATASSGKGGAPDALNGLRYVADVARTLPLTLGASNLRELHQARLGWTVQTDAFLVNTAARHGLSALSPSHLPTAAAAKDIETDEEGAGVDPVVLRRSLLRSRQAALAFDYYARSRVPEELESRLAATRRLLDRDLLEMSKRDKAEREKQAKAQQAASNASAAAATQRLRQAFEEKNKQAASAAAAAMVTAAAAAGSAKFKPLTPQDHQMRQGLDGLVTIALSAALAKAAAEAKEGRVPGPSTGGAAAGGTGTASPAVAQAKAAGVKRERPADPQEQDGGDAAPPKEKRPAKEPKAAAAKQQKPAGEQQPAAVGAAAGAGGEQKRAAERGANQRKVPDSCMPVLCRIVRGGSLRGIDFLVDEFLESPCMVALPDAEMPSARQVKAIIECVGRRHSKASGGWKLDPEFEYLADLSPEEAAARLASAPLDFKALAKEKKDEKEKEKEKTEERLRLKQQLSEANAAAKTGLAPSSVPQTKASEPLAPTTATAASSMPAAVAINQQIQIQHLQQLAALQLAQMAHLAGYGLYVNGFQAAPAVAPAVLPGGTGGVPATAPVAVPAAPGALPAAVPVAVPAAPGALPAAAPVAVPAAAPVAALAAIPTVVALPVPMAVTTPAVVPQTPSSGDAVASVSESSPHGQ